MVAEIKDSQKNEINELSIGENPVYIDKLGLLDLSKFDLPNNKYEGRIYSLSPEELQAILEAIGFTARFDHKSIFNAYFQYITGQAFVLIEMAKSTRPTDVGLRYTKERWTCLTKVTGRGLPKPHCVLEFETIGLPAEVMESVAKALKLPKDDIELFFVRVNFKDLTFALIAQEDQKTHLPDGGIHTFSLPIKTIAASENITASIIGEGDMTSAPPLTQSVDAPAPPREKTMNATKDSSTSLNTPRYATYSMSEVDLLLKKQAENIASNFNSRIATQQKTIIELTKEQEHKNTKIADQLQVYCENVRKSLENAESKHLVATKQLVEQAQKDLAFEIEQFKSYVNKQVSPGLKSLDSRILSFLKAQDQTAQPKAKENATPLYVAIAALVLALINFAILFLKH